MKISFDDKRVRAVDLAELLVAGDRAFERFYKANWPGEAPKLSVTAIDEGSVEVVFDLEQVVDHAKTATALLGPFINHIVHVIQALRGGGRTNAADRRFVNSLVEPVAKDRATQVNLINNGTVVLNVDQGLAEELKRLLRPEPVVREARQVVEGVGAPRLSPEQVRQLEGPGLQGTALLVEREWYARLVGGGGVLVPITKSGETTLQHNVRHTFRGRPERGRLGEIVGISISGADPH